MTSERDVQKLTALLAEPSAALLDLAPVDKMAARLSEQLVAEPVKTSRVRHWLPIAASLFAVFIGGAMIGRYYFPTIPEYTGPPRWITAAVDHTNLYTTETMLAHALSDEQKAELIALASQHVETDLGAIANDTARAEFQNGDLMEFEGKRLVQLNFLYETGVPFALYLLRTPDTDGDSTLQAVEFRKWQIDELATVRWARPGYEFYAVGRLTREEVDGVAEAIDDGIR